MRKTIFRSGRVAIVAMLIGLIGMAGSVRAAEYWLRADFTQITMPDGQTVPMWGYALDADNDFATLDGTVQVPGPELSLPPGESLTIHLKNNLPEPTSIVIPGQIADTMTPVRFTEGGLAGRIRSFTAEAAANGGEQTYSWATVPFKSGTFLYQSGSHPGIQVPMGLYGAVKADAAVGEAYPGVAYDSAVTLLFSEIDPVQHAAVANGTYGTAAYPGTLVVGYQAKYFLINGNSYSLAAPAAPIPVTGTTLLRFLNAGLRGRMPVVQGNYWRLVAEDGNPKPFDLQQYSLDLQPGMTIDAILQPAASGPVAIYDRSLGLSTAGFASGGMYVFLDSAAKVILQQPNGGEMLYAGTSYSIQWTAIPPASSYELHYSLDNGATWNLIQQVGSGSASSFDWIVPAVTTIQATSLIKVTAFDQAGAAISVDQSDAAFTIIPTPLQVIVPNGGETLVSDTTFTIQWNGDPAAAGYALDFSLDNGASWTPIQQVEAVTSFAWNVPAVGTDQTTSLVRVTALNADAIPIGADRSDAPFTIAPSPVQLTSPNGGETLISGTAFTIQWIASSSAAGYSLDFSIDNGTTWTLIQQVGAVTSFYWEVPVVTTDQTSSLVRVTAYDQAGASTSVDQSDATFTIAASPVQLTNPNGGETLISGTAFTIQWIASSVAASYSLDYSTDNGATWTLIQQVGMATSYNWTVPVVTTAQTTSLVRVTARTASGATLSTDRSDAPFTIAPPPTFQVLSPNGGEILTSGTVHALRWNPATGAASYRVYYSLNNGANWTTIQFVGPVSSLDWTVPNVATAQPACRILVRAFNAAGSQIGSDISDAPFTIEPAATLPFQVVSPNGGETLTSGTVHTIRWNPNLGADSYRLNYSLDNGATWLSMVWVGNVTDYAWTVPNVATAQTACRVLVRAYTGGTRLATDLSDAPFTIAPVAPAAQTLKIKKAAR